RVIRTGTRSVTTSPLFLTKRAATWLTRPPSTSTRTLANTKKTFITCGCLRRASAHPRLHLQLRLPQQLRLLRHQRQRQPRPLLLRLQRRLHLHLRPRRGRSQRLGLAPRRRRGRKAAVVVGTSRCDVRTAQRAVPTSDRL